MNPQAPECISVASGNISYCSSPVKIFVTVATVQQYYAFQCDNFGDSAALGGSSRLVAVRHGLVVRPLNSRTRIATIMAKAPRGDGSPVIIKKYANRRLYNTETSAYITLDDLAKMTRDGREFQVVDAKSGEDITHTVLTQIIMDEEGRGQTMLPAGFLRQLISMYGDSMQAMVPQYLEASMDAFRKNHDQFRSALEGAITSGPFGEIAKRNLAMFEAAASAFRPKSASEKSGSEKTSPDKKDDEIAALKAQLADLQSKIDKLG
jgi:polyhydroxyalkanoate synthesis repressor PhaR